MVKPLPPATDADLYDQYWYGDPYSNTSISDRGYRHARKLLDKTLVAIRTDGQGFEFFEIARGDGVTGFQKITKSANPPFWQASPPYEERISRFGISWEDLSSREDRKYWVAGSRLKLMDLDSNTVIAERIGFFIEAGFGSIAGQRRPWQASHSDTTTCPSISTSGYSDNWFVFRVLEPVKDAANGK